MRKMITWNGETKTIADWSRSLGGNIWMVGDRLRDGWPLELAITTPAGSQGRTVVKPEDRTRPRRGEPKRSELEEIKRLAMRGKW